MQLQSMIFIIYCLHFFSRWSCLVTGNYKLFRARCHVLLLLFDVIQARTEAINMVEKVHHANSNGNFNYLTFKLQLVHIFSRIIVY